MEEMVGVKSRHMFNVQDKIGCHWCSLVRMIPLIFFFFTNAKFTIREYSCVENQTHQQPLEQSESRKLC